MTDHDLLHRYAHDGNEAAFAELVGRHLDMVYSVARRIVRAPELAEEVAQSTFVDLARRARGFDPATPLVPWLHVVARRSAVDVVRRETRRRAREQHAAQLAAMNPSPESWNEIEPLLDEAVESLDQADRHAILLRYFENKSLREVGAALGFSDDAAQKRMSRAVEQLRGFLVRRGVAVTAAGLATDLSAHALSTAPVGLGATIAGSAAAAGTAGTLLLTEVAKTVAMKTLQKSLIGLAVALVVGTALVEVTLAARQREEARALQQQTDTLFAKVRQTRLERDREARRLDAIRSRGAGAEAASRLSAGDRAVAAAINAWLGRVGQLKRVLAERPEWAIPELALLSEDLWLGLAQDFKLDSEKDVRKALARLRQSAENAMANTLTPALRSYVADHHDQLPTDIAELAPYCRPAVDPALLSRYEMTMAGALSDISPKQRTSIIIERAPVDLEEDRIWHIGTSGFSSDSVLSFAVHAAQKDFAAANGGAPASSAVELRPYLKWPLADAAIQTELDRTLRK